jgi:acetyl-CoA carboxylase carboxyl transferase subunit alpha
MDGKVQREEPRFERPILELERRIEVLRSRGLPDDSPVLVRLQRRVAELEETVYRGLTPWQRVQLARHPKRPTALSYLGFVCDEFLELHGDRRFKDDPAVVAGLGRIGELRCVVIAHEKGRTTKERIARNFGMAHPEGFRKALRVMKLAGRFGLPILSFVDTPGAYPGIGAEERGQPQAIAEIIQDAFGLGVPIVAVIIGEGGSGGALALAVADRVLMMKHAVYSVISPEGCAAILWRNRENAPEAATALKLTAADCRGFGVVDMIIDEIHGAAHRNPAANGALMREIVLAEISELSDVPRGELLRRRFLKYRMMGVFREGCSPQ